MNRNKAIDLFVGNISNSAVHRILEKAIDEENIRNHYGKEFSVSLDIAKRYRDNINPKDAPPDKDIARIKEKIERKVSAELKLRISKGYKGISLELVETTVNELLKKTRVIE